MNLWCTIIFMLTTIIRTLIPPTHDGQFENIVRFCSASKVTSSASKVTKTWILSSITWTNFYQYYMYTLQCGSPSIIWGCTLLEDKEITIVMALITINNLDQLHNESVETQVTRLSYIWHLGSKWLGWYKYVCHAQLQVPVMHEVLNIAWGWSVLNFKAKPINEMKGLTLCATVFYSIQGCYVYLG